MKIAKMNGSTLVSVGTPKELYPNTKFPVGGPTDDWLTNASCVKAVEFLDFNKATHRSESVTPYISDGTVYTRRVVALTSDEIAAIAAAVVVATKLRNRAERDRRLAACDWVATKALEAGGSVPSAWVTYRTALRNITAHSNWPDLVYPDMNGDGGDWPTSP